jgi:hypothetical protein
MKLMDFEGTDGGSGPCHCKIMKMLPCEEVDVALLQWFVQKQAEETCLWSRVLTEIPGFS